MCLKLRREAWARGIDLEVINTYAVVEVLGVNEVVQKEDVE